MSVLIMITMDVSHPDIEKFVTMKHDLTKVTGANVSVKVNDSFMKAVENKESFTLQFPIDSDSPTITHEVDAVELWGKIVKSATETAEPGLLMWGNITKNLPAECYSDVGFKTLTTNPCGEIPLSAYDSCRVISINLKNFVKNEFEEDAQFDFVEFSETVTNAMRLSDDLVEYGDGTTASIEQMSKDVTTFLMWAAEPHLESRHQMGFKAIVYLIILLMFSFYQ